MLLPAPPLYPRRRKKRRAPEVALLNITSVEVIDWSGAVLFLTAVFNTTPEAPLADVSGADPAKWTARYQDTLFNATALSIVDFNRLSIEMVIGASAPGENELVYTNAPSDIGDTLGRTLSACAVPFE